MPEEDMAEMDTATLDFGGPLDADDLITYDENEGIEWVKPTSSHSTPATKSAVGLPLNEIRDGLSASHGEVADPDFGLLEETAGGVDAGGDEIDWDAHEDNAGGQPAVADEAPAADDFGITTANDVVQLPDDEVLYDETGEDDAFADQDAADGVAPVAGDFATDTRNKDMDILSFEDTAAHLGGTDQAAGGLSGLGNEELDEITYEDDADEADGAAASSSHGNSEIAADDEVASGQDIGTASQGGEDLEEADSAMDHSDSHDLDNQSEADGPVVDGQVMILDDDDEDEEADDASSTPAIPTITVCYRSEEFPLFKGAPGAGQKMPFFSNLAPLEFTMDRLLASFRQELSDELGLNDEIVLQIDELGLEFSESTQRDSLAEVTLRQLLQIFDQLVKNQDPDSSRPLYTYVFTRPNPAKRLESLIEDAFAGKGLDEVVHYFHPSAHNANSDPVVEAAEVDDDKYPEDYESYEESDEAAEVDQPAAADEGQEYEESDEDIDDGERSAASLSDDQVSGDGSNDAGSEINERNEDAQSIHAADQPAEQQTTDNHVAFDFTNDDDTEVAAAYNDFDDADQFFQPDDETFDDLGAGDDDAQHADLEAGQDVLVADEASKVTSSTSATATLNGEDEIDFENDLNDPTSLASAPEAEVPDEIQWTEADDEHVEPSGTGKRPREEDIDELGEGDMNGVKRRRS